MQALSLMEELEVLSKQEDTQVLFPNLKTSNKSLGYVVAVVPSPWSKWKLFVHSNCFCKLDWRSFRYQNSFIKKVSQFTRETKFPSNEALSKATVRVLRLLGDTEVTAAYSQVLKIPIFLTKYPDWSRTRIFHD